HMLTFATNVVTEHACDIGGHAYLYFLDLNTGMNMASATDGMAGLLLGGNALEAGIKTVMLSTGKTVTIVTDTASNIGTENNPGAGGGSSAVLRRTTWREIPD